MTLPPTLQRFWSNPPKKHAYRWYLPSLGAGDPLSLKTAIAALGTSAMAVPDGLIPVSYVDDRSLVCVVCRPDGGDAAGTEGSVVRWHLDRIPERRQGAVLDQDILQYAESVIEDADAYEAGYRGAKYRGRRFKGIMALSAEYQARFGSATGQRPKPETLRPFQLACQNVIIGLAAMRHEPRLNALMVEYWQTCEVPHVATHEASRALIALMLCDAFQAGGTMEINFERHPEGKVPAVLRRFGRSVDITLGEASPHRDEEAGVSISPAEARDLFLAVTPMPSSLRTRIDRLVRTGLVSAEEICFSLLSPVWRAIELEFILGCSARVVSILKGGAPFEDHAARQPELEIARAALMAGMYHRRLDSKDLAGGVEGTGGAEVARVFDDASHGVRWKIHDSDGAVEFTNVPMGSLPWLGGADAGVEGVDGRVVVLPRPHVMPSDSDTAARLSTEMGVPVVLIVPRGASVRGLAGARILTCPEELGTLDAQIERKFLSSRLSRT